MASAPQKSVVVAYLLWLVGGIFGLHLWYLEREAQAAMYQTTFGCFGLGWLLDFFYLPGYVQEANKYAPGSEYLAKAAKYNWGGKDLDRGFGVASFFGFHVLASWYGGLMWWVDPVDFPYIGTFVGILMATCALNCGRKTFGAPWSKLYVLVGVYYGWNAYVALVSGTIKSAWMVRQALGCFQSLLSVSQYTRPEKEPSVGRSGSTGSRVGKFFLVVAWIVAVTANVEVTDQAGEKHSLLGAFSVGLDKVKIIWGNAEKMDWDERFKTFASAVRGDEDVALEALNLKRGATPDEIRKAYRALSREFHPDRNPDAPEGRMQEINQAYETLNRLHKIRGQHA
eukprot:TRINITY_DN32376_c0_g1_i1.p1 TRINITY_DN32376_c0_g1~~TRINITY_DN32376_c0_g1_i1.p1  ORF type:complete len:358 (+),score=153.53 TRINITY_DN32376_c0_g1_i1:55-1074(+)